MTRRSLGLLVGLAVVFVVTHAFLGSRLGVDDDDLIVDWMWLEVPTYLLAVIVVLCDRGADSAATRRAVAGILVVAGILRAMVVTIDPVSTDINRYIWDGRVQATGINPYRYIPADPALEDLRDDDIYPEINRKEYAPTIYPPFAQIVFFLVTRVTDTVVGMKAAMTLFDLVTIWALLRLLRLRGQPPTRILLYAWHPLPLWAFAVDGHVDAVAVACICLALLATQLEKPILAGIALGGATLTKFSPVVIGPALWRRWDWRLPLAGFATLVVLYLPYVGVGKKLFGFMSGYSAEEGYRDGSGVYLWLLLKHLIPSFPDRAVALYSPLAALIMGALALGIVMQKHAAGANMRGALMLAAVSTALTSPHYQWYMVWLVPFLCFVTSWSVLWITTAATYMSIFGWPSSLLGGTILFLPFIVGGLVEMLVPILRNIRLRRATPAAHPP